jgi:hypothetical protein
MATARQRDYSDLDLDFIAHPLTGDVVKKTGPDAVARSIRNLILTNFYDRPFRSFIGSSSQKMLFDNVSSMTAINLETAITQVIENFEPRAKIIGVKAVVSEDGNGYSVRIAFGVNNRPEPYQVTIFLQRIR